MKSLLFVTLLMASGWAAAQTPTSSSSDSLDLARSKSYTAWRVSSNAFFAGSNDDSKRIMPGETLLMADLAGPGVIDHIWVTIADNEYAWPRLLRLRVYYDGHKTPSVDVPLGDFFASGHGYERDVSSAMVRNSSFGRARNSYWPMPYEKSCRITVTNEGNRFVTSFYYHVDYRKYPVLPENVYYFHAYYRQELPAVHGQNYEFLNIRGDGHYVGTVLSVIQTQEGWFGEGDDLFYVDGEKKTRIEGTGTEDYFNDAWGLRVSNGDWVGIPIAEGEGVGARLTGYRWHVPDPIPFTKSLRAGIEHFGWTYNPDGTARSGFEERPDFFSSVAFWYQKGVNEGLSEPPYGEARLPLGNAQQIEVENEASDVWSEKGKVSVQKEVFWSKDLLFFEAQGAGARMKVPIEIPEDGRYEVLAQIAQSPDYGDYVVTLDDKLTNSIIQTWAQTDVAPPGVEVIHNYSPETYVAVDRRFGWFDLKKGRHTLTFTCIGKDSRSAGYNLGVDDVVVERLPSLIQASISALSKEPGSEDAATQQSVLYRGRPLSFYTQEAQNPVSRAAAFRAIGSFGSEANSAIPQVIAALRDSDATVRSAAAWALTQIAPKNDAGTVAALAQALSDSSPRVRGLAAVALREIGSGATAAVPSLITALSDPVAYVRAPAADALGSIGPAARAAVGPLSQRLLVPGEQVFVLRSIAAALGNIGPDAREALPALEQALKMLRVTYVAQEAILKITGKPVPSYR